MTWPTVDDLAQYANVTFDDGASAAAAVVLELLKAQAQAEARSRIEEVADDEVVLRGTWDYELRLPERPVTAVSSVSFVRQNAPPYVVPVYWWTPHGSLFRGRQLQWPLLSAAEPPVDAPWGPGYLDWLGPEALVKVTYTHGYAEIPADVRAVILQAARRTLANPDAVEGERVGSYEVTYARRLDPGRSVHEFTDAELRILHRYRRTTL